MREHPYRDQWDESRIIMSIDEDEYTAYCTPNAEGRIFIDGTPSRETYENNAPFGVDVLFDEVPEDDEALVEDLGEHFNEEFRESCNDVFEKVEESDDPLQTILDMESDELSGEVEFQSGGGQ